MKRIPPTIGPAVDIDDLTEPYAPPPRKPERRKLRVLAWSVVAFIVLLHAAIALLRWVPPPVSAFMLQSPTQPVRYRWIPRDRIAESTRRAVIAAEDQKFWDHRGFDIEAIGKAIEHNKAGGKTRGASTISQQVAKNMFLWSGQSWLRKGLEVWLTLYIEATWGKERILEVYLNVAEFGPGTYGVSAAAEQYFRKTARQLTARESARLAAVLPSPRKWKVIGAGPYVVSRTDWILRQMGEVSALP